MCVAPSPMMTLERSIGRLELVRSAAADDDDNAPTLDLCLVVLLAIDL